MMNENFSEQYKTYIILKITLFTIQIKKSEINRTISLITINFQNFTKIKLNLTYFNVKECLHMLYIDFYR
jgi:hypothetical protein